MTDFFDRIAAVNSVINDFVWVKIGLILLIGTGILMTCCTGFFQISHIGHWWKMTIGSLFVRDSNTTKKTDRKTISQFQALCTALASVPAISQVSPPPSSSAAPAPYSGCGLPPSLA